MRALCSFITHNILNSKVFIFAVLILSSFAVMLSYQPTYAYTLNPISSTDLHYYGTYTSGSNTGLTSNCYFSEFPYVYQGVCNNGLANGSWTRDNNIDYYPFMTGPIWRGSANTYAVITQLSTSFTVDEAMAGDSFVYQLDFDITDSNGVVLNDFNLSGFSYNLGICNLSLNNFSYLSDIPCQFSTVNNNPIGQLQFVIDLENYTYNEGDVFTVYAYGPYNQDNTIQEFMITYSAYTDSYFNWSASWYVPDGEGGTTGSIEEIVDEWREQDDSHFSEQLDIINDNASNAEASGNTLQNLFNFVIIDPLSNLFGMFSDEGCVQVPTIASWLHVDNATYCSWWPSTIRSVLTPVFTIGGTLLLWGFVMNWLRNDGAFVEINDDNVRLRSRK